MNIILTIIKWILIILFFPLSLVVVGYYKQKKAKKDYWIEKDDAESTTYNNTYN